MNGEIQSVITQKRFDVLDGMRGVAAFAVMAMHYSGKDSWIFKNAGSAVDLFFILSGFVIAHSYSKKLITGSMTLCNFLCRRVVRLYPMFFVGLIIGALGLGVLHHLGKTAYSYQDIILSTLCNLFFIPYFSPKDIGSIFPVNGPSWSLFFELFINVFCLILFKLSDATIRRLIMYMYGLMIVYGAWEGFIHETNTIEIAAGWQIQNFVGGFPRVFYGFTFGILIYRIMQDDEKLKQISAYTTFINRRPFLLYLLLSAVFSFPIYFYGLPYFITVGIIAPVCVLIGSVSRCQDMFTLTISRFLGWISYPLYCLHLPIKNLIHILFEKNKLPLYPARWLEISSIICTLIISYLITKYYESLITKDINENLIKVNKIN